MLIRALVVVLWLLPGWALAEDYPRPTSDTVNDFAELLTPNEEAALESRLRVARKASGVHVVLVTLKSRASVGFADTALEPFATGLFNDWGIGDAKRNDGVMILVLPGDREMRVELGAGFPASFDKVAQDIADHEFLPAFRKGDYPAGIKTGTEAVITYIAWGLVVANEVPPKTPGPADWLFFVVLSPIFFFVIYFGSNMIPAFERCLNCGKRGLQRSFVPLLAADNTLSGREVVTTTCPACGHVVVENRALPTQDDTDSNGSIGGSSGGSGGFGGGHSSGGGASGDW